MERFGWLAAVAEPPLLGLMAVAVGLPWLLLPGPPGVALSAAAVAAVLWWNYRLETSVRRLPIRVGPEAMQDQVAVVVDRLGPAGVVRCGGELWRAMEVRGRPVEPGQRVRVVRVRGLLLEVERVG